MRISETVKYNVESLANIKNTKYVNTLHWLMLICLMVPFELRFYGKEALKRKVKSNAEFYWFDIIHK